MPAELQISIKVPDLSEAQLRRVHRASGMFALRHFIDKRLPGRFNGRMARELRWEERSERYKKRKRFYGSENVPHRFKGETRRKILSGGARPIASPRSRVKRLRVVMRGLNPGYKRRPDPGRPNMADELKRMTKAEVAEIAQNYAAEYSRQVQVELTKPKRKRRVKG